MILRWYGIDYSIQVNLIDMAKKIKQESMDGWQDMARAYAKAEKELEIKHFFRVEFRKMPARELVWSYDLPRELFWKWDWVIRWRQARLICLYPRDNITQFIIPYDKTTGLEVGWNSALSSLASLKAHITMLENERVKYIASQQGQLFFDVNTDSHLLRIAEKLAEKKDKYLQKETEIRKMVERHQKALKQSN